MCEKGGVVCNAYGRVGMVCVRRVEWGMIWTAILTQHLIRAYNESMTLMHHTLKFCLIDLVKESIDGQPSVHLELCVSHHDVSACTAHLHACLVQPPF